MSLTFFIIALIILTFLSGFFSGTETAFFSLSPMTIKAYRGHPKPRKRLIAKLLLQPRDLLVTVFMLNTLVNILLQNVASSMFGAEAGFDLKVGVPLVITLFLGEIIPKNIGFQNNLIIAKLTAPTINFLQNACTPFRRAIVWVTAPISRLIFFFLKKEEKISTEELEHVLQTSQKKGVLNQDEAELVSGFLRLQEISVKELMTPKNQILAYDLTENLEKLKNLFVNQKCTRIPIYERHLDNFMGVCSANSFFIHRDVIKESKDIQKYLTRPPFIPETTSGWSLMKKLNEEDQELALVVDEYGTITGLVTQEDLAEVIIGQITDLRDQNPLYTRSSRNEIIASGKLDLATFNAIFNVHLESPHHMATIGGWLTEQMGDIPKDGMRFQTDQFFFYILSSYPTRIRRLYIRKLRKKK